MLSPSTKGRSGGGGVHRRIFFFKTDMRFDNFFGVNLINFKVILLFSVYIWKNVQLYKNTMENKMYHYFLLTKLPVIKMKFNQGLVGYVRKSLDAIFNWIEGELSQELFLNSPCSLVHIPAASLAEITTFYKWQSITFIIRTWKCKFTKILAIKIHTLINYKQC